MELQTILQLAMAFALGLMFSAPFIVYKSNNLVELAEKHAKKEVEEHLEKVKNIIATESAKANTRYDLLKEVKDLEYRTTYDSYRNIYGMNLEEAYHRKVALEFALTLVTNKTI